jgi:hypothetical protein
MKVIDALYLAAIGFLVLWLGRNLGILTDPGITFAAVIGVQIIVYVLLKRPSEWRNPMHDGYPTAFYASRQNPPWACPREVSSLGSRTDRADYRVLERRLERISELAPRPDIDWAPRVLLRDRQTGQHWCRELREAGFNQFFVLVPVADADGGRLHDERPPASST